MANNFCFRDSISDNTDSFNNEIDPDVQFYSNFNASSLCQYYSVYDFYTSVSNTPANVFSTFHLNIRSLAKHYDELVHFLYAIDHSLLYQRHG